MLKLIISLSVLSSCASFREQDLPEFDEKKVCSSKSLEYLNSSSLTTNSKKGSSKEEVQEQMMKLKSEVLKCFREELARTRNPSLKFHLCHITGFDEKGVQEYFQFSARNTELTASMKYCLKDIRTKVKITNLKNVKIIQPFALKAN